MPIQEYIQLVKVLNGDKLLEFAKKFFVNKYKGNGVTIEECEWENSYILTILRNSSEIKRFIHISGVTEDLKSFIESNIANIAEHSNSRVFRRLECFCLSQIEDKESLIEKADFDFGVTLEIIDIDVLRDYIEREKNLRDFLTSDISTFSTQPRKFDQKDKLLYDLFATGNKIADLKNSFISSYIQYYLFELGPQSVVDLKNNLYNPLPNLSSRAFDDAIDQCRTDGIIHFSDGKYDLTEDCRTRLEELRALTIATEDRLLKQFEECLEKYNLKDISHFILDKILELYKALNNSELATLNHQNDSDLAEKRLVLELFDLLIHRGIDKTIANSIVQDILTIISDSDYLSKVSATTLFTSLFNSDSLDQYLGMQKRIVFIDTQVLMQLICVEYQDVPYEDSLYEAGRILLQQLEDSENYLCLFTTSDYIREISNHLFEAYNLKRFVDLPYIKDFGPSKNIFYNFYLYLNELNDNDFSCYEDYIEDLLNTDLPLPNNYPDFVAIADKLVIDLLNSIGITIKPINPPTNLTSLRRDYDILLGNHPKKNKARENDVLCMYYLSDQTNFINNETRLIEEPYFITLDTTILPMRKKLVDNYQRSYWYIYPPLKFANRLSIMNLKLNSKNINYDIICMAETNFKASYETISMLDIMSKFFKKDEIGNKKLPRLLAQMKAEERNSDHLRDYSDNNHNNLPIDVVLNDIHKHYRNLGISYLDNISRLFEIDELSDTIFNLLKSACNKVLQNNRVEDGLFKELDKLTNQQILEEINRN